MPVPLIAAAGSAPAVVSGIKSGIGAIGSVLGIGKKTSQPGRHLTVEQNNAVIDAKYAAGDAAYLQAIIATTGRLAWPDANRARAQTRLDQLLAANRAASGGGAPASMFAAGPGVAAGGSGYDVASSNRSASSGALLSAGMSWPLMAGAALVVGALLYFFVLKKKR